MAKGILYSNGNLIGQNAGIGQSNGMTGSAYDHSGMTSKGNRDFYKTNDFQSDGKLGSWLDNALTGQRDYDRSITALEKEQEFSHKEAEINRQWSENMSNTSYQRAMNDLKKAGLNPALLAQIGGASSPSGSMASSPTATRFSSGQQFGAVLSLVGTALSMATRAQLMSHREKMFDRKMDFLTYKQNVR